MKVIGSKVIVKKLPDTETTKGGIILPGSGVRNTPKGEVISVPEEYVENGLLRKTSFKNGDEVLFVLKSAVKLDIEHELYCVEINNIICVTKEI